MCTSNAKERQAASSLQIARIGERKKKEKKKVVAVLARPEWLASVGHVQQDVAVSSYKDQQYNGEIAKEKHQPE